MSSKKSSGPKAAGGAKQSASRTKAPPAKVQPKMMAFFKREPVEVDGEGEEASVESPPATKAVASPAPPAGGATPTKAPPAKATPVKMKSEPTLPASTPKSKAAGPAAKSPAAVGAKAAKRPAATSLGMEPVDEECEEIASTPRASKRQKTSATKPEPDDSAEAQPPAPAKKGRAEEHEHKSHTKSPACGRDEKNGSPAAMEVDGEDKDDLGTIDSFPHAEEEKSTPSTKRTGRRAATATAAAAVAATESIAPVAGVAAAAATSSISAKKAAKPPAAASDDLEILTAHTPATKKPAPPSTSAAAGAATSTSAVTKKKLDPRLILQKGAFTSSEDEDSDDDEFILPNAKKKKRKMVPASGSKGAAAAAVSSSAAPSGSGSSHALVSSSGRKAAGGLSFTRPPKRTLDMHAGETMIDPGQYLQNTLQSREFLDFHDLFEAKMDWLCRLLRDAAFHPLFTGDMLVKLFLQLQMSWLHVRYAKEGHNNNKANPLLPPIVSLEAEVHDRPWSVHEMQVFLHVLQTVGHKMERILAAARESIATPTPPAATSTSPPPSAAAASSSSSSSSPVFSQFSVGRLRVLVLILIEHFTAHYAGSHSPAITPGAKQQFHLAYFETCTAFLHQLVDGVVDASEVDADGAAAAGGPMMKLPEGDMKKVREWLLRIFAHDVKLAGEVRQRKELRRSNSSNSSSCGGVGGSDLVTSTIRCCSTCEHALPRPSPPFLSLSSTARRSLDLFLHLTFAQGFHRNAAQSLGDLLKEHLLADLTQLTLVGHVRPAFWRVYFVGLLGLLLFPRVMTHNETFFSPGLDVDLPPFVEHDTFHRGTTAHPFLSAHLDFARHLVDVLAAAYAKLVESYHGFKNKVAREQRFDKSDSDALAQALWHSGVKRKETRGTTAAASAAVAHHHQPSLGTVFARQNLTALEKADAAAAASQPKLTKEQQLAQEAVKIEGARKDQLRLESARKANEFGDQQRQYAHLLAMLLEAVSEQVHDHMELHHPRHEQDDAPMADEASQPSAPTAAAAPLHRTESEVCIPDSQMSDVDQQPQSDELARSASVPTMADSDEIDRTAATGGSEEVVIAATPSASQASDASLHTSPIKEKKPRRKVPQPCDCSLVESTCDTLREKFRSLHTRVHLLQSEILVEPPVKLG